MEFFEHFEYFEHMEYFECFEHMQYFGHFGYFEHLRYFQQFEHFELLKLFEFTNSSWYQKYSNTIKADQSKVTLSSLRVKLLGGWPLPILTNPLDAP